MATIIEYNALWTLTEPAAEVMVEKNLIFRCEHPHNGIIDADLPIYHVHRKSPDWFGFTTIPGAIRDAEQKVS